MTAYNSWKQKHTGMALWFTGLVFWLCSTPAMAGDDEKWRVGLETGAVWQQRNDVRIPGNVGTRFSLDDLVSPGGLGYVRLELSYPLASRHGLRFLWAPFEFSKTGVLDKDVFFVDETFIEGRKTRATYRFNSYRVSYRYTLHDGEDGRWLLGFTAKIRDAKIALRQGDQYTADSNVGFVPLLHVYGEYPLAPRWSAVVDFDGLLGPQGRAFDLGLLVRYEVSQSWYLGGGYRMLEGGADNDEVYNFAWFHYGAILLGARF